MAIKDILTIVSILLGFVTSILIPAVTIMINRIKAVKRANEKTVAAKTEEEKQRAEAEKQSAINDLKNLALGFVAEAEALYKDVDAIVKGQGKTCGALKKDSVMTKIQDACITKGVGFDKEYWSKEVDNFVAITRKVNAKQ